ncbi:MAG: SDR family oxidoreductase [Firmicutes bacterium]|nr:SDR family oxidoreductase [Bacillota bacterium]
MEMQGRVALVTGGSRGIGAATCKLLGARGAKVAVNFARDQASADAVVAKLRKLGAEAFAVRADVRDDEQVRAMVDAVSQRHGPIDILVSNAGMSFAVKPIAQMQWSEFAQKLNDELKAAFILTQAVTPAMMERRYGRIVYVASGLARRPGANMAAHGSAKAALAQFARYVAAEYGPHGILANVISPGLVRTDATRHQPQENMERVARLTPLGRVADPEDVAHAIALLAGDDCRFITGAYIPVNGGQSMD